MNQIKTGALISYCSIALNIITGLLYTPWMINTIGKADYGLYTLAMSVISLFIFDFGLGSAVTRFISKYLAENRQDKVDNLLGLVFKLYLVGDLIILLGLSLLYVFLPAVYNGLSIEELQSFKIIFIIASIFSVLSFPFIPLNGVLISYEKFIPLKSCDLLHKIIIVALMSVCLLYHAGVFALVLVNSIAGVIIILLKLYVLGKKRLKAINWTYYDSTLLRSIFGFSVWVTVIQLSQRCIFNIAPSFLAIFENSTAITILGISTCLEGYSYTLANALNGMFLPQISRYLVKHDNEGIERLMIKVGRLQIYLIGLLCVGFICTGKTFIQSWMGVGFEDVYLCTLMLIIPSFLQLPQEVGNGTMIAAGKVKEQAIAFIVMALLNLALAFPLTKLWGVEGLCLSISIAYIARTIIMDILFYKVININVISFFKKSYLKIMPSILISCLISVLIIRFIPLKGWIGFVCQAIVTVTIYSLSSYFLAFNNYEKDLLLNMLLKVFKKHRIND